MYRNVAKVYDRVSKAESVWETTWNEKGERITLVTPTQPYLFYEDASPKPKKSEYISMNGKPLKKEVFRTSNDRKKWMDEHKDTGLFEELALPKQYLLDKYCGQEQTSEFIKNPFKVFFFDIEVEIQEGFPEAKYADYPINVISIFDTLLNKITVWCYKVDVFDVCNDEKIDTFIARVKKNYGCESTDIDIRRFDDEKRLLTDFLDFWSSDYPDIISGWNIDGFDVKYIINRITKVFCDIPFGEEVIFKPVDMEDEEAVMHSVYGCDQVKLLSPIHAYDKKMCIVQEKQQVLKKTVMNYKIKGLSICDYMLLYKKFGGSSQQSFKLDYIAKKDLNKGKLDYYDLGYNSMKTFMQQDFATFVEYNIIDSILVKQLDDERKFLNIMRLICNFGLCEYDNIFKTTPSIIGALCIEARKRGMKFITNSNKSEEVGDEDSYEGAFVFPTTAGYYKNGIVSYDFNSLYPNTMITLNISPETYVGQIVEKNNDGAVIRTKVGKKTKDTYVTTAQLKKILDEKCTLAANNMLSFKPTYRLGIMPSFLSHLYDSRVKLKKKAKTLKKQAQEIQKEIDALQKELDSIKD